MPTSFAYFVSGFGSDSIETGWIRVLRALAGPRRPVSRRAYRACREGMAPKTQSDLRAGPSRAWSMAVFHREWRAVLLTSTVEQAWSRSSMARMKPAEIPAHGGESLRCPAAVPGAWWGRSGDLQGWEW